MKREFLQNLKVGDQPLSKEVIDAILAENGEGPFVQLDCTIRAGETHNYISVQNYRLLLTTEFLGAIISIDENR